jgi:hypothetical protein
MNDRDPAPSPQRHGADPSLQDIADAALRKIVTGVVLASGVIALAIYARPAPPRYEAVIGDGKVVRIDTRTGTMIQCDAQACRTILRRGQPLSANPYRRGADRDEDEEPVRALPAPAPAPVPVPAPAPAPAPAPTGR